MSLNKVQLIGYIGKDPEVTTIPSGIKVAKFQMATSESYKDKNGNKVDKSEWHNIIAWGSQADIIEKYLKKGKQIYVEGKLTTRSWDDKKSGDKRYITEIILLNFSFLGKKDDSSYSQEQNGDMPYDNSSQPQSAKKETSTRYSSPDKKTKSEPEAQQASNVMSTEIDDLPF